MNKIFFLLLSASMTLLAYEIKSTPIKFGEKRIELTQQYIKEHYDLDVDNIKIVPKIILIHYTAIAGFEKSLARFRSETLPLDRPDIVGAGALNVSTHFMVERDGTIHQLMPLNIMARHVIGLNYNSIGIENVGGEGFVEDLTEAQLKANVFLINFLKRKYSSIEYVVGHHEYRCFENTELWLEKDEGYRTKKHDPGPKFMDALRERITDLKKAPCD